MALCIYYLFKNLKNPITSKQCQVFWYDKKTVSEQMVVNWDVEKYVQWISKLFIPERKTLCLFPQARCKRG